MCCGISHLVLVFLLLTFKCQRGCCLLLQTILRKTSEVMIFTEGWYYFCGLSDTDNRKKYWTFFSGYRLFSGRDASVNLTLSRRRSVSYSNQSIDLRCRLMDWFLYDTDLRHERVKWPSILNSGSVIVQYCIILFV